MAAKDDLVKKAINDLIEKMRDNRLQASVVHSGPLSTIMEMLMQRIDFLEDRVEQLELHLDKS